MEENAGTARTHQEILMPDLKTTNAGHAKRVAKRIHVSGNAIHPVFGDMWHWVNGIADGIGHFFGSTLVNLAKAVWQHMDTVVDVLQEILYLEWRLATWVDRLVWHVVRGWIYDLARRVQARMRQNTAYLIRLIYVTSQAVLSAALNWVRAERKARIRDVNRARAQARAEIRAMHHTIEREAASGYMVGQGDRLDEIVKLLEYAVVRVPILKHFVGRLAGLVLDLLSVDNPVARLLVGFLINHVIDKLGIDKLVGAAAKDMLEPLLGEPKPRDLHDVIVDMSRRMLNEEKQWTQFYANGGAQVEQAGDFWRNITGPLGTAAIVAFTAEAVTHPDAWAQGINDTIGRAATDVIDGAVKLFKGV